jgi:hypothetical protein
MVHDAISRWENEGGAVQPAFVVRPDRVPRAQTIRFFAMPAAASNTDALRIATVKTRPTSADRREQR